MHAGTLTSSAGTSVSLSLKDRRWTEGVLLYSRQLFDLDNKFMTLALL